MTPPSVLARTVQAFWRFDGFSAESTELHHRVIPDGCMDFLFDLSTGMARFVGPMSRAQVLVLPRESRLFGVRFRPGSGSAFLDAHAHELLDRDARIDEVTTVHLRGLDVRIAQARTDHDRMSIITALLLDPRAKTRATDARLQHATWLLGHPERASSVPRTAAEVGLGERQLERLFTQHVGVGPKLFARIARLERAVSQLNHQVVHLSTFAAQAGYADEAHLIREFRALTGVTPRMMLRERNVGFVQSQTGSPALQHCP